MATYTSYTPGARGLVKAIGDSLATIWNRRWLAIYFARRDLIGNYRSSHLGFLWAFLSPLLMIVLLTLVFSQILHLRFREVVGDTDLNFGLYLYCGLLPFMAFTDALNRSTNAIRNNSALVQKIVFPVEILPLTRTLTLLTDKLLGTVMLILVVLVLAHRLSWTILLLPLVMALQLVFTLGLSYLFAVIGTYLPDVRGFLRAFTRALFFITPIIWTPDRLPENLRFLVYYNPLAFLVQSYRDLILENTVPDLWSTLWFSSIAVALCVVGFVVFVRVKQNFADML